MKISLLGSLLVACVYCSSATAAEDSSLILGINYIGVTVSDIESSTEFYTSAADLKVVESSQLKNIAALDAIANRSGVSANTRLLRSSNAQLRLMQFTDSASEQPNPELAVYGPGIAHICYQVADDTETYQRFLQAGASPIGERDLVQLNPANPVVYAYARDRDAIIFEVEHIDFDQVSRPRKNDYRIRHVSLATPNMDRQVAFYSVLMGEPEPRRRGQGGTLAGENFDKVSGHTGTRLEMTWFQTRNLELEIIQYHSHPTELPANPRPIDALGYNMIVFDVSDLAAARSRFIAAGGAVLSDSQTMDAGELFFGRDPDGNLLGFQRAPASAAVSSQNFDGNGT